MNNLPDITLGELWYHILAKHPVGNCGALYDLCLQHLVDQDNQHLEQVFKINIEIKKKKEYKLKNKNRWFIFS